MSTSPHCHTESGETTHCWTTRELLEQAVGALRNAGPVTRDLVARRIEAHLSDDPASTGVKP